MACGSGCCGPPKEGSGDTPMETKTSAVNDSSSEPDLSEKHGDGETRTGDKCNKDVIGGTTGNECVPVTVGCCSDGAGDGAALVDDCCAGKGATNACGDATQPEKECGNGCAESCCVGKAVGVKKGVSGCNDGCCSDRVDGSKMEQTAKETAKCKSNDCCSSEKSGCAKPAQIVIESTEKVAESCADACCSTAPKKAETDDRPDCCAGETTPCCDDDCVELLAQRASSVVRQEARSMYAARLEALGCLCRALVALGDETCCSAKGKAKKKPARNPSVKARASKPGNCTDGCCDATAEPAPKKSADCCRPAQETLMKSGRTGQVPFTYDDEKGPPVHAVLAITGMTCTGCETKLSRTLASHPAVSRVQTSLVLARVEFDCTGSIEDVVRHIERTTEFTCEQVDSVSGASLDICGDPGRLVCLVDKKGVREVRPIDGKKEQNKRIVSVQFDAQTIGARAVLKAAQDLDENASLAPLRTGDPALAAGRRHVRYTAYTTLLSIILTVPVLVLAWAPLDTSGHKKTIYESVSLALASGVQFAIAGPFYPRALKALLFSRVIEMDLLVVLSTTAAYIFSIVSFALEMRGQPMESGSFFETSTLLVTLIVLGRWVAALARQKAVESISVRSLQATHTIVVLDGQDQDIDTRLLEYGDVFVVPPDTAIPTDGTVISGMSDVDESMISGESRPVLKEPGSKLVAGSINGPGSLRARVVRLPAENTISAIATMVDNAKLSKPRIQALADRIASVFVPVVVALAVSVFCIWMAVGVTVQHKTAANAASKAIVYAMTVLIVSCPCAVGLAVPMVVVIATGIAAERGVVFKNAEAMEVLHRAAHVVLDKTGTVTEGKLSVTNEWFESSEGLVAATTKQMLLTLLQGIKHPVAKSVAEHLVAQETSPLDQAVAHDITALPGKGVEGTVEGKILKAGNSRWLALQDHPAVENMLAAGLTTFCFTVDGQLAAVFGLADALRPDSAEAVARMQASGIAVHLVSGDDDGAVIGAANQLGIPHELVRSRCSPAEKRDYIRTLTGPEGGKTTSKTAVFVGDGTNDAAALAQATVGVHINSDAGATDVAQAAADVVLVRPSLSSLLVARAISQKAAGRIVFNFVWSAVYNLFAILLAAGAFEAIGNRKVGIPPEYAGLGELVSVLPVVAAAVLLRWAKY